MCWRSFTAKESFPNTIRSRCVCATIPHSIILHPLLSFLSCSVWYSVSVSFWRNDCLHAHKHMVWRYWRLVKFLWFSVKSITKMLSHSPPFLDKSCGGDTPSASTLAPDVSRSGPIWTVDLSGCSRRFYIVVCTLDSVTNFSLFNLSITHHPPRIQDEVFSSLADCFSTKLIWLIQWLPLFTVVHGDKVLIAEVDQYWKTDFATVSDFEWWLFWTFEPFILCISFIASPQYYSI